MRLRCSESSGSGRWKTMLPTAYLRCGFAAPCRTAKEVGADFKSSHLLKVSHAC